MELRKIFLALLVTVANTAFAATYYVGTGQTWTTLSQINFTSINAGDSILFNRGQKFSGRLTIGKSGTSTAYIYFGAYGTGANPLFWGTGSVISELFNTNGKSYLLFENLTISDTTIAKDNENNVPAKVQIGWSGGGSYIKIKRCIIDRIGIGAFFEGGNSEFSYNDVSYLKMVKNDTLIDNDYGANPVVLYSAFNRIEYNNFHDCWAKSYDYIYDGGCVELINSKASNNWIAYNTFQNAFTVTELGANDGLGGTIQNNIFAYNKCINNGYIAYFNNAGRYNILAANIQFYNNIFIETTIGVLNEPKLIGMAASSSQVGIFVFKNNIFWLTSGIDLVQSGRFSASNIIHENNQYYLTNGSVTNYTLNASEQASNPLWTSVSGSPTTWDLHLTASSWGVERGQVISGVSTIDFAGVAIVNNPEIGLYEYGTVIVPPPPPPPPPTPTPTRTFYLRGAYQKLIIKNGS